MDDAEQLLPAYLRFVRGVVDSNDLPLNVSREILQESKDIEAIRAGCTKKVLALLENLATERKGQVREVLERVRPRPEGGRWRGLRNREKIAATAALRLDARAMRQRRPCRSPTTSARMKEGQDKIYYVTAETFNAARNSPHLEVFRKKGIEVLLLSDRVDEWVVGHLPSSRARHWFPSPRAGSISARSRTRPRRKEGERGGDRAQDADWHGSRASLGERVKDVRVTRRLTESPACLVADEHDVSAQSCADAEGGGPARCPIRSRSSRSTRSIRSCCG